MAKPRYKPGQVIWARVPDRNGVVKDKARPILVILVHPKIRDAPLFGLAISTRADNYPQDDPVIEMPWDASTGSTTGLYEWCAVVLLWRVAVEQVDIERTSGAVSDEFMETLSEKMKEVEFWISQVRKCKR